MRKEEGVVEQHKMINIGQEEYNNMLEERDWLKGELNKQHP